VSLLRVQFFDGRKSIHNLKCYIVLMRYCCVTWSIRHKRSILINNPRVEKFKLGYLSKPIASRKLTVRALVDRPKTSTLILAQSAGPYFNLENERWEFGLNVEARFGVIRVWTVSWAITEQLFRFHWGQLVLLNLFKPKLILIRRLYRLCSTVHKFDLYLTGKHGWATA